MPDQRKRRKKKHSKDRPPSELELYVARALVDWWRHRLFGDLLAQNDARARALREFNMNDKPEHLDA